MRALVLLSLLAACHPPGWDKDPAVDAAATLDTAGSDAAADPDAGEPDATLTCARTFRLEGHAGATAALVTGTFVDWAGTAADGALAMTLGADQAWTVAHDLAAGEHQYRFIVDGTWIADPNNPDQVPNGLGGFNSLVRCP
ncbi:MAG TPA: glycogen-binding domain-containing protein [Kofleriaceae bacterium]|jgi:hypothetical protein|nr:glycogen-binding domain-containing protein [Kofleriaceae bacterium]